MRKNYIAPIMEVELLEQVDIVTASSAKATMANYGVATTKELYGGQSGEHDGATLYSIGGDLQSAW